MHILIATPIYPPEIGGPATYTKELVEKLHKDHTITILTYAHGADPLPGATLIAIEKHMPLPKRLVAFFLKTYSAAKDADVIYVQNAMAAGLPAVLVGMLRRTPVILKFVGDEAWERASQHKKTTKRLEEFLIEPDGGFKISLMRMLQGWVLRRATIVTTPSVYLGEVITRAYRLDPKRVITNYNAAEVTTEAPFAVEPKPHQLVATARLVAWKGIDGIIEAVKILKDKYADIKLIVHGDGPERASLEALAKNLSVESEVVFTGNVSRVETWHTRKESAVYVLNSTYEGLPHTALTCFAAEIPIVATDIAGTNEAVYHEESGLLVPAQNPIALAAAIERLFNNPELGKKVVEGGNKILREKFSWEAHIKNLLGLFESVRSKPLK